MPHDPRGGSTTRQVEIRKNLKTSLGPLGDPARAPPRTDGTATTPASCWARGWNPVADRNHAARPSDSQCVPRTESTVSGSRAAGADLLIPMVLGRAGGCCDPRLCPRVRLSGATASPEDLPRCVGAKKNAAPQGGTASMIAVGRLGPEVRTQIEPQAAWARFRSLRFTSISAICTVFRAAPLRRLSATHQNERPFSTVASSRMRET
jgi:hypothetical protein